jgi:WD40 repeat protein
MTNSYSNTKEMLEIKKDLFAIKFQDKYIKIIKNKLNNKWISLKSDLEINKLLIDRNNNLLISLDKQQSIKFWDINEIEKRFKDSNENEFVNIIPLYEFKHSNKILELIVMENNILCGCEDKILFTYKYDINQKTHNLMKKINCENTLQNLVEIKRKEKNFLCCKDDNYLVFLDIPQLTEINRIKIGKWKNELCYYEQIYENEIIIGIDRCLKILNLDYFKITLSKKINIEIRCIKKLKDTSILVGGRKIVKRFSIQTMEELPQLIVFDQNNSDSDEDYGIGQGVIDLTKDVQRIKELSNGNIMLFLKYDINIYGLNIDS